MQTTFIYGLKDPRDGKIYYIGKSNYPKLRFEAHLADKASNKFKTEWINGLLGSDLLPELDILEEVVRSEWQEKEKQWIAKGISEKWPLTNMTAGGTGLTERLLVDWSEVMYMYLPPELLDKFNGFEFKKQTKIARDIALRMLDFSWSGIRKAGGEPSIEYDQDLQYFEGAKIAKRLVAEA